MNETTIFIMAVTVVKCGIATCVLTAAVGIFLSLISMHLCS